jgi:hypothetical protein
MHDFVPVFFFYFLAFRRRHFPESSDVRIFAAENRFVEIKSFPAVSVEGKVDVYCCHKMIVLS